jgi:hypothetical protein
MQQRKALPIFILSALSSTVLIGQQSETPTPAGALQFPVVLTQNVTAGKTPVGTRVEAKLSVATLVGGKVVPKNALFSGEVIESAAKTASDPSRLAIRMNSIQWKDGSTTLAAYFDGWFYPTVEEAGQELLYGPQSQRRNWNGQGQYPDPNSKVYRPFPGSDADKSSAAPDTPSSTTSKNCVAMKGVEPQHGVDGRIALVSKRSNIKLDRYTTYVLAAVELAAQK